jgi:nucleotide-binding universal stress UspA family protein
MALLRKILVTVDGSEPSLNALREGCRLARSERARIVAMTVAPPYEGDLNLVGVRNVHGIMNEPCDRGFTASETIAREEGVVAEHLSTTGEIQTRIVEVATEYGCDLIILGYDRRPAVWRVLTSSVVPSVVASSPIDVLVIPRDTRFDWQTFLVVLKEPKSAVRTAERALDFARAYGARLLVAVTAAKSSPMRVPQASVLQHEFQECEPARFLQELLERAESVNVRAEPVPLEGRPLPAAIKLAQQERVGLTILDPEILAARRNIFAERYAGFALQRFPSPVLVVHP